MAAVGESWGRYPRARQQILGLHDRALPLPAFEGTVLPHGNGRSYGDSCLNPEGTLLHTRGLDRFIAFDADTGVLECEAGVLLSELLELVVPRGWFLPVTPGTRLATVGGAIANDVHGKNHHVAGTFGAHVLDFQLLRSDGTRRICNAGDDWFGATVGGLGLTGLITRARLQLRRVPGPWLQVHTQRFGDLDGFFACSSHSATHEYTVAWVDCLARGRALGRGVFMRADHVAASDGRRGCPPKAAPSRSVPVTPPVSLVNRASLGAFNGLYFHRARRARDDIQHYQPFFYPLDAIADWNRIYGPRGFFQFQCVVPPGEAPATVARMLERIATSGQGSFLGVLKQFGDIPSPGWLSFPRPGTTLALDFPNRGAPTLALLAALEDMAMQAGGALYPAKDAHMSAAAFRASFPRLEAFTAYVDPRFSSGLWRRVMDIE